jgi:uncharacterized membrane protein
MRREVRNVDNAGISFSIRTYLWPGIGVVLCVISLLRLAFIGDWHYFEVACVMYVVVWLLYRETRLVHKLRREIEALKAASPRDEAQPK